MAEVIGYEPLDGFPLCESTPRAPGRRPVDVWYGPHEAPRGLTVANHEFLVSEWDWDQNVIAPNRALINGREKLWWVCSVCEISWSANARQRRDLMGNCPSKCLPKVRMPLEETHPQLFAMLMVKPPVNTLFADSLVVMDWNCEFGHMTRYQVNSVVERGCMECRRQARNINRLGDTAFKDALDMSQADIEEILTELVRSKRNAVWVCEAGHSFGRRISRYVDGMTNCLECERPYKSVADGFPQLVIEWSPRNTVSASEHSPYLNSYVWWVCFKCGHEWETLVANRTHKGSGCPVCWKRQSSSQLEIRFGVQLSAMLGEELGLNQRVMMGESWSFPDVSTHDGIRVEYDGHHWHRDKVTNDDIRYDHLIEVSLAVIRVREFPLPLTRPYDIHHHVALNDSMEMPARQVCDMIIAIRQNALLLVD